MKFPRGGEGVKRERFLEIPGRCTKGSFVAGSTAFFRLSRAIKTAIRTIRTRMWILRIEFSPFWRPSPFSTDASETNFTSVFPVLWLSSTPSSSSSYRIKFDACYESSKLPARNFTQDFLLIFFFFFFLQLA